MSLVWWWIALYLMFQVLQPLNFFYVRPRVYHVTPISMGLVKYTYIRYIRLIVLR